MGKNIQINSLPGRERIPIIELDILLKIVLSGILVGFCFDFYRIIRWKTGLKRILTLIGDLFFSLVALLIIYYFAQKANFLEWRFYLFAGCLLGLVIYLLLLSSIVKKIYKIIFDVIGGLYNFIAKILSALWRGFIGIISAIMSVPYSILRWIGLLFFRMGEAAGRESADKVRKKIFKNPKI